MHSAQLCADAGRVELEMLGTHGFRLRNSRACEFLLCDGGDEHLQAIRRWLHGKGAIAEVERTAFPLFKVGDFFGKNSGDLALIVKQSPADVKTWLRSPAAVGPGTSKLLRAKELYPCPGREASFLGKPRG